MNKPSKEQLSPLRQHAPIGSQVADQCAIAFFARACGLPVNEVAEWIADGTLPSLLVNGERVVDVRRLRADLLGDKEVFAQGDYSHD